MLTGRTRWSISPGKYRTADSVLTTGGLLPLRKQDYSVEAINVSDGSVAWKSDATVAGAICYATAGLLTNTPEGDLLVLVCALPELLLARCVHRKAFPLLGWLQ